MATIETRTTPEGKNSYRVKIRIRGFPSQSATFERKTDAKNWAAQTESAIREGRYFKNTAAKKYTARYLEHQQNRNQKRSLDVCAYLAWWDKEIGMYLLSDLNKTLILEKRDKLLQSGVNVERRAPATVNRYMGVLSHAISINHSPVMATT